MIEELIPWAGSGQGVSSNAYEIGEEEDSAFGEWE